MSNQKKYYFSFISLNGDTHLVEIWQNTTVTLTAAEIKCEPVPFSVELPDLEHKFQTIRGRGCELNLTSETNMQLFIGLYHEDKKEFMVKHYINGSVNFLGYLNSELFNEPFDFLTNYPIQVLGNDGFALLDRLQFLQSNGSIYTGIKSLFEILTICIDRIGLPFSAINIALSTTSPTFSIASHSTILHSVFVDSANFYTEDGTAETMRKVLEAILNPFGAFIVQKNGAIWITDIHTIAQNSTITFESFVYSSSWLWSETVTFIPSKTVAEIGYFGTGQQIEQSGGKNKQVVSYSPYPAGVIIPACLGDPTEYDLTISWSTKNGYVYGVLTNNKSFNVYSPGTFETSYIYTDKVSTYLRFPRQTTNVKIADLKINPFISASAGNWNVGYYIKGAGIKISGKVLVKTKNNPYSSTEAGKPVSRIGLTGKLKVGAKWYTSYLGSSSWVAVDGFLPNDITAGVDDNGKSLTDFRDTWQDISTTIIPIVNYDISGGIVFELWSNYYLNPVHSLNHVDVKEIWIKDFKLEFVNPTTGDAMQNTDKEYIGYLNTLEKDEATKIDLLCGTDITCIDHGKMMYQNGSDYSSLATFTRAGQSFCIEKLLLNSLSSNYKTGYYTLSGMKLNNSFDVLNVITDAYLSGKVFMIKSLRINYRDNSTECTLIEISPDNLTIIE